jgi:hypothetical protein
LKTSFIIADVRRNLFDCWLLFFSLFIISRIAKLTLRYFKNESLFNMNSCFFLLKWKIVEIVTTRDAKKVVKIETIRNAKKIMKMTRITNESWCVESSFFSIAFASSMMKSSIKWLLLIVDIIVYRFDFFAFVVACITRTIDFSTYLFSSSLDQFIEIARKFFTIFIRWTFLIISFIISLSRKNS